MTYYRKVSKIDDGDRVSSWIFIAALIGLWLGFFCGLEGSLIKFGLGMFILTAATLLNYRLAIKVVWEKIR